MKERKQMTLCMFQDPKTGKILLGMKKRGFGAGRYNGFGGKLEPGETPEQSAKREVLEEIGVTIKDMELVGHILFSIEGDEKDPEVFIYRVMSWEGEPVESEEMAPEWFEVDKLPFDRMWQSDTHWFPLFLEGKRFIGRTLFNSKHEILNYLYQEGDSSVTM